MHENLGNRPTVDNLMGDNLEVVAICTGAFGVQYDSNNNAISLPKREVIEIGESHLRSHRRIHNPIIESLITDNTAILIEENAAECFNGTAREISSQLEFISKEKIEKAAIFGWESPEVNLLFEEISNVLYETIRKNEASEQELFNKVMETAKKLYADYQDACACDIQPESKCFIANLHADVISCYIRTALMLAELNFTNLNSVWEQVERERFQLVLSPEIIALRTAYLIAVKNQVSQDFKRIIIVGGRSHFELGNQDIFYDSVNEYYDSFGNQMILAIFTHKDLAEESNTEGQPKTKIPFLNEHLSNRIVRLKIYERLSQPIASWFTH
jgi:hypothetical protein